MVAPSAVQTTTVLGLAVVGVGVVVSSVTVVASGPLLAVLGATELSRYRRTSSDRGQTSELIDIVDAVILRLRSGDSIRLALSECSVEVEPHRSDDGAGSWLDAAVAMLQSGHTLRAAVTALVDDPRTTADDRLRLTAATLSALAERGGPAVPALQRLRFALAGIGQATDEAAAQAGQARASSVLMAVAPVGFAVTLASLDAEARYLYLYSTSGLVCLLVAVILSYGGWWWMAVVIDRSVNSSVRGRSRLRRRPPSHRRRRRANSNQNLGLVIELVSMVLAAGGTVRDAVEFVARSGPEPERQMFSQTLARTIAGELLVDALPAVSDELGGSYRSLVAALVLSEEGGAAIALTLSQLSDEADAARRRQLELRAKRISVTLLIPLLLCALPALIVGAVVPLVIVALSHLNG